MRRSSMDAGYFRDLYAQGDGDPWRFATSEYEQRKYAATLAALPRPRYKSALEVGCSIGVLTRLLGERCDALLAIDPVEQALLQARQRCSGLPHVSFRKNEVPREWPTGSYDLIVLSEVVYYLTRSQVGALATRIDESLAPDGEVILVHWIGETDYPLSGDEAAETLIGSAPFLSVIRQERTEDYRLDLCARRSASGAA